MEPKYALSQGDVKKKKHKITINPQKKIAWGWRNSRGRGTVGVVEPCFGSSGRAASAAAATRGSSAIKAGYITILNRYKQSGQAVAPPEIGL